jgi:hypothetical protein
MQLPVQLLISVSSYGAEGIVYFAVQRRAVGLDGTARS